MILYDTKYLQLKNAKSKNGLDWVYAHRPNVSDVVVILPVINNKQVLFIVEERPPIQAEFGKIFTVGLPAGLVGDERKGETTQEAIRAELLEETGLKADDIKIKVKNVASSAGCVSETFTIAVAHIKKYEIIEEPIDDNGVIVDRKLVNIEEIPLWLKNCEQNNMFLTSQMLSALYYLNEEIQK